jgi:hypothetical protein
MSHLVRSSSPFARLLITGTLVLSLLGAMSQTVLAAVRSAEPAAGTGHVTTAAAASQVRARLEARRSAGGAGETATAFPLITGGSLLLVSLLLFAAGLTMIAGGARASSSVRSAGGLED